MRGSIEVSQLCWAGLQWRLLVAWDGMGWQSRVWDRQPATKAAV